MKQNLKVSRVMVAAENTWDLRLYVIDSEPRSMAAFKNLKNICDSHPEHHYNLEVIDLKEQPEMAKKEQIFAVPTLQRLSPEPRKLLVGDFSTPAGVLKSLGIYKI